MGRTVEPCPVETTLDVIGGEWKVLILWELLDGTKRFSQLQRAVGGITQKMLTQQLRALETDGLVSRKVYPVVPPKVEYSLTPYGRSIEAVLDSMCNWGECHIKRRRKKRTSRKLPVPGKAAMTDAV